MIAVTVMLQDVDDDGDHNCKRFAPSALAGPQVK